MVEKRGGGGEITQLFLLVPVGFHRIHCLLKKCLILPSDTLFIGKDIDGYLIRWL